MSKYTILKTYEQTLMMVEDILGDGITKNTQLDKLGFIIFGPDYLGTYTVMKCQNTLKITSVSF